MTKFGRMDGNRNAYKFLADTYGLFYWIFDAEIVRVEIRVSFVVSLRPKGAAFGQAGSTQLDSVEFLRHHGPPMLKGNASMKLLRLVLGKCPASGAILIIGGDFNASICLLPDGSEDFFPSAPFTRKRPWLRVRDWSSSRHTMNTKGKIPGPRYVLEGAGTWLEGGSGGVSAKSWLQLGIGFNVVKMWCGSAEKGGCEGVMAARVANMDKTLPWHEILQIWKGYGLATKGA